MYKTFEKSANKLQTFSYDSFRCLQTNPFTTKTDTNKKNESKYSDSILLPKSNYPMRHSRKLELQVENESSFTKRYESKANAKQYVLHDGPPYANGDLHFGHAVNKILKDIICRRKAMEKFEVCFTPGWDCHGLPIELKVLSDQQMLSPLEIRQKARHFAKEAVESQKKSFMRWGLRADWDNPYITNDSKYINNQLKIFYELFKNGLIIKDYMPVYWSPSTRSSLAEAELQYNDNHISKSVYVKYKLKNLPHFVDYKDVYALIWTTTPWTLPANQAIAYARNQNYSVVIVNKLSDDYFLVATDLLSTLENVFDCKIDVKQTFSGSLLDGIMYENCMVFDNQTLPLLASDRVNVTKGTGLVHISPNHGADDYNLIIKNNIQIQDCIVDEAGVYKSNNLELNGKFILTEGTESVIKMMKNHILFEHDFSHSYPYDWRSKQPVIIRASRQWFINLNSIRDECIDSLKNVIFYPEVFKTNLINQLKIRPNWCISRQRSWGLPIPVFYSINDKSFENPIINDDIFAHILKQFNQFGCDSWWKNSVEELLPEIFLKNNFQMKTSDIIKGQDIFDIWFDSGISWYNALPEPKIADIYLEGYDQIRGWFQSSLIISVALRKCAPYKVVFIHGFALDKDGKKMSKSLGNVIDPNDIIDNNKLSCGMDGLRLWVTLNAASHDNVHVSIEDFENISLKINKIRSIIRFMIGSLFNFNYSEHKCDYNEMRIIDKYLLHLLHKNLIHTNDCYNNLNISLLTIKTLHFMFEDISAFYFSRIKDRLYCDEEYSLNRKSCRTVLFYLYKSLTHVLFPILPHIITEAEKHLKFDNQTILADSQWNQENIVQIMALPLSIISLIDKLTDGNSILYDCYIKPLSKECLENLMIFQSMPASHDSDLCEILKVSSVSYASELPQLDGHLLSGSCGETFNYELLLTKSANYLCNRCRRYVSKTENHLCFRCLNLMNLMKS